MFVIYGSFQRNSRDELHELTEVHGGKNLASVSSNTDFLLAGDKIGPAKLTKATKLGINIVDESAFEQMIAGAQNNDSNTEKVDNHTPDGGVEENLTTRENSPTQGSLF